MQAPVPKGAGGARGAENDKNPVPLPGRCSQEQTCSRGSGGHQAPTYTHHKRRTRPHMHRVNRSRARWPRLDMLSSVALAAVRSRPRCLRRGAGALWNSTFLGQLSSKIILDNFLRNSFTGAVARLRAARRALPPAARRSPPCPSNERRRRPREPAGSRPSPRPSSSASSSSSVRFV